MIVLFPENQSAASAAYQSAWTFSPRPLGGHNVLTHYEWMGKFKEKRGKSASRLKFMGGVHARLALALVL